MKFKQYKQGLFLESLIKTRQSEVFILVDGVKKTVCKLPKNNEELQREMRAYGYINKTKINIPEIFLMGEDFFEMEYIERTGKSKIKEVIREISKLYNCQTSMVGFLRRDLSKKKVLSRLDYLPIEIQKKGLNFRDIISKAKKFTIKEYKEPPISCLVHGDLKTPHIIQKQEKIYFIDWGQFCIANPWYDISFLFMEEQNKKGLTHFLSEVCCEYLDPAICKINKKESFNFLKSSVFYRTLYNLIYSMRHRPLKTINRIKGELEAILES